MRSLLRTFVVVALLVVAPASAMAPAMAQGGVTPAPAVGMASGILVDLDTGKILWAHNDREVRAPASLTKILTALVVLEKANLDEGAPITADARAAPGSRTFAEAGWMFTIRDHLWGLMLQSGNDSALSLAHKLSPDGTVEGFMAMANRRAAELGAKDTNFVNPHGYDADGHVTTARDLGLITMQAMRNPVFAEMVASKTHAVPWGDGQPHLYINHNKLLRRYQGTVGVKTGFTSKAGHSLASAVTRDGHTLILIVLGSPDHYGESISLYDWGFANLPALIAYPVGQMQPSTAKLPTEKEESGGGGGAGPARVERKLGLEIVQIDKPLQERADNTSISPNSAPLLGPIVALIFAGCVGLWIVRRRARRQSDTVLMEFLHRDFEAYTGAGSPRPKVHQTAEF